MLLSCVFNVECCCWQHLAVALCLPLRRSHIRFRSRKQYGVGLTSLDLLFKYRCQFRVWGRVVVGCLERWFPVAKGSASVHMPADLDSLTSCVPFRLQAKIWALWVRFLHTGHCCWGEYPPKTAPERGLGGRGRSLILDITKFLTTKILSSEIFPLQISSLKTSPPPSRLDAHKLHPREL